uniref:ADP/ATP translocase n=1 Tax=Panagrellus redivivus TaxID=6233 RepID=A0A7E4VIS8_PANRE
MKYATDQSELLLLPVPPGTKMAFVWPNADDAIKFGKDFSIGGAAAVLAKTIVAPIERVKLILQLQASQVTIAADKRYNGMIDCFIRVPKEQGFISFWRGNGTNILRASSQESLGMGFKEFFKPYCINGIDPKTNYWRFLGGNLMAGGLSGCATFCFIYPLDFTRTRLAVDMGKNIHTREFQGLVDCFYKIFKADGFFGLYRGFIPSLQYIFMYRSVYYGLFDSIKSNVEDTGYAVGFTGAFCIGQVTTFVAAMSSYPLDTVRRRLMMLAGSEGRKRMTTLECARNIYFNEGPKAFFNGALVNAIRGVGAALVLALYSEVHKVM